MKITERAVNSQGHTLGFKIAGRWCGRKEAVSLVKQGKIQGFSIRRGSNDEQFIASLPSNDVKLYDLPIRVQSARPIRRAARR